MYQTKHAARLPKQKQIRMLRRFSQTVDKQLNIKRLANR